MHHRGGYRPALPARFDRRHGTSAVAIGDSPHIPLHRIARTPSAHNIPPSRSALPPFTLVSVGTVRCVAFPQSFRNRLETLMPAPTGQHCSVPFAKPPPGPSPAPLVPQGCALAALQRLVPSGFFACRPAGGLLRKEKSLCHGALASLALPSRSLSPPALAPTGFLLVRRCAVP